MKTFKSIFTLVALVLCCQLVSATTPDSTYTDSPERRGSTKNGTDENGNTNTRDMNRTKRDKDSTQYPGATPTPDRFGTSSQR